MGLLSTPALLLPLCQSTPIYISSIKQYLIYSVKKSNYKPHKETEKNDMKIEKTPYETWVL